MYQCSGDIRSRTHLTDLSHSATGRFSQCLTLSGSTQEITSIMSIITPPRALFLMQADLTLLPKNTYPVMSLIGMNSARPSGQTGVCVAMSGDVTTFPKTTA